MKYNIQDLVALLLLANPNLTFGKEETIEFQTVSISSLRSGRCLTNLGNVGLTLSVCPPNQTIPQQWDLGPDHGTSLTSPNFISARTTTRCIEVEGAGIVPIITECEPNNVGQEWERLPASGSDTWFQLRNNFRGQCLQGLHDRTLIMKDCLVYSPTAKNYKTFLQQVYEITPSPVQVQPQPKLYSPC